MVNMWTLLSEKSNFNTIAMAILFYVALIIGMAVFAIYNLWKFPAISTSEQGVELQMFFCRVQIEWKNIIQTHRKNNRLIIYLKRKGLFLNRLYGLFDVKVWDQPVILLDLDHDVIERLENEIKAHVKASL